MKVTALVENTKLEGRKDLIAEPGLSLHIQYGDKQILFDTGVTKAFGQNAERLGIDIGAVDLAVISHHHYDHGGGLSEFLARNERARVVMTQSETEEYYFKFLGILKKHVGLDKAVLQEHAHRIEFVEGSAEVSPGVHVLARIEGPYPQPKGNQRLVVRKGGTWRPDRFEHELMVVMREGEGLVVLSGCSHNGILNMIHTVQEQFAGPPIKAVFGGFHLIGLPVLNTMAVSRSEVEDIARSLLKSGIERIFTGHCTGPKGYEVLKGVLGEHLELLPTGRSVEI